MQHVGGGGVLHIGRGNRCVRCLHMPQGGVAVSAWGGIDGFVTICGGCEDGRWWRSGRILELIGRLFRVGGGVMGPKLKYVVFPLNRGTPIFGPDPKDYFICMPDKIGVIRCVV